jgi:peptidoglycan L-alanyl-D-glutamate endopeptidase CwlK
MRAAVEAVLEETREWTRRMAIGETLRTAERQEFLHGFGRIYDDGRGIVTAATTNLTSWHGYGLAVDLVVVGVADPWAEQFHDDYRAMGDIAEQHGLTWGGRWKHADLPHVQWGLCPASPTSEDQQTLLNPTEGLRAVWEKYGAI